MNRSKEIRSNFENLLCKFTGGNTESHGKLFVDRLMKVLDDHIGYLDGPIMGRTWAMPNKETFKCIKPIKELLDRYVPKDSDNNWVNPFSGKSLLCEHNNDINPDINPNPMDAAEYIKKLGQKKFPGVLFDPPFSLNQATTLYNQFHKEKGKGLFCVKPSSMVYWSKLKDDIANKIELGGYCISFGWNSMGLGKNRGFEQVEILLVPHGGSRNDTIVVVERKVSKTFSKLKRSKKK